jgi:hypothetical protein
LQAKQRIKASARASGSIRAANTGACQRPTEIHVDEQETMKNFNQQIQHGQPRSSTPALVDSGISSFSLIHEPLHHNINEQIQHAQPRSSNSAAMDSGISSFSFMHDPLPKCSTLQDVVIPTSNQNSMPLDMQSSGGAVEVEEDHYMDKLMEYPLRHSPQCLLLKPVPGVKTHPDYVFEN